MAFDDSIRPQKGFRYTAPHSPWGREHHPAHIYDSYDDCSFESVPDEPTHPWQIATCPQGSGEERREFLKGYYAAVTAMDIGIGKIIDKLDGTREPVTGFGQLNLAGPAGLGDRAFHLGDVIDK